MNDKDLNNTSRTNWEALESMDDEGIDYSDIPPLTEEFFENATLWIPAPQAQQLIKLNSDIRNSTTESRAKISSHDEARAELDGELSKPGWLEKRNNLPFEMLSSDEFEVFCYLLLLYENPQDNIYYYGKTGDAGRDVVWQKNDSSIELIQCKRYQSNVGIGEIRTEIAKLYVNCYKQSIPERPTSVVFYVVPDLTAPAQDLVNYPEKWVRATESGLKDYLEDPFKEEIVGFALHWSPKFSKQAAIDLTQRAKKYPTLIEEFFEYKKVVDSTSIDALRREMLEEFRKTQAMIVQPSSPNAQPGFQNVLRRAEEENPGVIFSVNQTSENIIIEARAKSFAKAAKLANLSFPNTEPGNRGAEKFRVLVEEGRAVELDADEYSFEWGISFPVIDGFPEPGEFKLETLKLIPNIPRSSIPCRFEVVNNGEVVFEIPFVYFRILRVGTKEIEFRITGKQLQGELVFISNLEKYVTTFTYKGFNLSTIPLQQAKSAMRLMQALYEYESVRVIALEDESILIKETEALTKKSDLDKEGYEATIGLLDKLGKINQVFNLNLSYPENRSAEIEEQINEVFHIISTGEMKYAEGTITLSCVPQKALELLNILKQDKDFSLSLNGEATEYFLMDQELDIGESKRVLKGLYLIDDIDSLEQAAIEAQNSGEKIALNLGYKESVEKYHRWNEENID